MPKNPRTGSSFDDFLKEEGIYEQCTATALKNILARQLAAEMKKKGYCPAPTESFNSLKNIGFTDGRI